MKGKPNLHISAQYLLNCGFCGKIIAKFDHNCPYLSLQYPNFVQNNRVSIIFHEIFRINVKLNFDLKFSSGILS